MSREKRTPSIPLPAASRAGPATLENELLDQTAAMVWYALESGLAVPPAALRAVDAAQGLRFRATREVDVRSDGGADGNDWADGDTLTALAQAHARLTRIVAPATPRTILLLVAGRDDTKFTSMLGPVRLVRHMLIVSAISLVLFIALATSPDINSSSGDIFQTSGRELLVNELFFLAAAGMGASFAALFRAHRYIGSTTYDPKYESSYWLRFILGLIAGVILPALVPLADTPNRSGNLTRPLLALLGGFSASFVYRALDRLVQTAESFVKGDSRDVDLAREEANRLRSTQEVFQDRLGVASAILALQGRLKAGADPNSLREELGALLDGLLSSPALVPDDDSRVEYPTRAASGNGANVAPAVEKAL